MTTGLAAATMGAEQKQVLIKHSPKPTNRIMVTPKIQYRVNIEDNLAKNMKWSSPMECNNSQGGLDASIQIN